MTMVPWTEDTPFLVECPRCGEPPGRPCRTSSGRKCYVHRIRISAAHAADLGMELTRYMALIKGDIPALLGYTPYV